MFGENEQKEITGNGSGVDDSIGRMIRVVPVNN